jgi:YjjG family noncanonical pyrimidine nucleotidase
MAGRYKYLLFDADGTLYDFGVTERYAIDETWKAMGLEKTDASVACYLRINAACWAEYEQGTVTIDELQLKRGTLFANEMGYTLDPNQFAQTYRSFLASKSVLFPESLEILTELKKRGYLLYICTNGIHEVQAARFNRPETEGLYERVFTPFVANSAKPFKPYYDFVFQAIGIDEGSKGSVLAIGDSLSSDVMGAINAGIDVIWYNPGKSPGKPGVTPTREIADLRELLTILPAITD